MVHFIEFKQVLSKTKRFQNSCVLLWFFLIPPYNKINPTRRAPLDISSLLWQTWTEYKSFIRLKPFIREKSTSCVLLLTKHEVCNVAARVSQLSISALYGKIRLVPLITSIDINFSATYSRKSVLILRIVSIDLLCILHNVPLEHQW